MRIGKKGSTLDVFWIMFALMFFGIMIVMSTYLGDQIFPSLISQFNDNKTTEVIQTSQRGFTALDNIFMFLFFMLNLVPVMFAVMVKHHPVFLIINIMVLIIFMLVAPVFSNVMREFLATPEFSQYTAGGGGSYTYWVMTRLFQYLPYVSVGISAILMVAMFFQKSSTGVTM